MVRRFVRIVEKHGLSIAQQSVDFNSDPMCACSRTSHRVGHRCAVPERGRRGDARRNVLFAAQLSLLRVRVPSRSADALRAVARALHADLAARV